MNIAHIQSFARSANWRFLAFQDGQLDSSVPDEGILRNRRGNVTIIDTEGLEEISCECYRLIREQEEALLA